MGPHDGAPCALAASAAHLAEAAVEKQHAVEMVARKSPVGGAVDGGAPRGARGVARGVARAPAREGGRCQDGDGGAKSDSRFGSDPTMDEHCAARLPRRRAA